MDFFEYASITEPFIDILNQLWLVFLVGGLCFAIVFIFQAVALYTIAGREGYKNRWMAFIPFLNTYYIGVCAQKNRVFRSVDTRTFSLIAAILEFVIFIGYLIYYVALGRLIAAGDIQPIRETSNYGWQITSYIVNSHTNLSWAAWCFEYLDTYVLYWLNLVFLFLQVIIFASFFQTYSSRRYMLFTITSVLFPIQGILFFILRNNKAMNYREYIRKEQERQYRMYQQYQQYQQQANQNPYSRNQYSNNSLYGYPQNEKTNSNGQSTNTSGVPEDPFAEFGSPAPSDPFDMDDKN